MTIERKIKYVDSKCAEQDCCEKCPVGKVIQDCLWTKWENMSESELDKTIACFNVNGSKVDHPSHYNQGDIECIDAMISAFGKHNVSVFCAINAFKYIWRSNDKNGMEDINKACWYLDKFKELREEV